MTPEDPPSTPAPPPLEITLEEWIAATQSCCGIELPDERAEPAETPPTPDQP